MIELRPAPLAAAFYTPWHVGWIGCHLILELLISGDGLFIKVIALPVESHAITMTSFNVSVQSVVSEVRLRPDKPLDLDWPLANVKIEPVRTKQPQRIPENPATSGCLSRLLVCVQQLCLFDR